MEHLNEILPVVVNFLAVVGVLFFATRKSAAAFLVTRREQVGGQILEAEKLWKEADADLRHWEGEWKSSEAHAKQLLDEARASSEHLKKTSLEKAATEASRIQREGELLGQTELARAKRSLQREVAERSIRAASQYLSGHVAEEDRSKLLNEYVEIVGHGSAR